MIYYLVLGEEKEHFQPSNCHVRKQNPKFHEFLHQENLGSVSPRFNIAQTCRVASEEAHEVIYKNNKFLFYLMSKEWLRPQISQKTADTMQKIHITIGNDKSSRGQSLQLLQKFSVSQAVRKECRIELAWVCDKDTELMRPIVQVLKDFTAFEVVIVTMARVQVSCWLNPVHAKAKSLWTHLEEQLKPALGTPVFAAHSYYRSLEFKPREYLVQKGRSSDAAT